MMKKLVFTFLFGGVILAITTISSLAKDREIELSFVHFPPVETKLANIKLLQIKIENRADHSIVAAASPLWEDDLVQADADNPHKMKPFSIPTQVKELTLSLQLFSGGVTKNSNNKPVLRPWGFHKAHKCELKTYNENGLALKGVTIVLSWSEKIEPVWKCEESYHE